MEYQTQSEQETKEIANNLSHTLLGGDILCLHGDLGAGKTTFVKGLAEGLGITDTILSPTFTLMNVYKIETLKHNNIKTLVHIDTYRLKDEQELAGIGALDFIGQPDSITVIEWPEKIAGTLHDQKCIHIYFEHRSEQHRLVRIIHK